MDFYQDTLLKLKKYWADRGCIVQEPYDTEVDVWLDPQRHWLPVKLRLAIPTSGDSSEFLLDRP